MLKKSSIGGTGPGLRMEFSTYRNSRTRNLVLAALDGTSIAERALPWAAALAQRWDAALRLVHVRNPFENVQEADFRLIDDSESLSFESRSEAYLKGLAESLQDSLGLSVSCQDVPGSSVANTLRSICEANARSLVLVRKRRSALSRFWWGSVTDGLIGRLAVPLLLVPDTGRADEGSDVVRARGFSRMLVHLVGTDASASVLNNAMSIASDDAVCHLLRVLPLTSLHATASSTLSSAYKLRNEAWLELFRARERLEQSGITCKPRLIFDGQGAGSAIVEQARAMQAEVVIVAARQHPSPWLTDGVAEYVARHSEVPVLVVPANSNVVPKPGENHVDIHSN